MKRLLEMAARPKKKITQKALKWFLGGLVLIQLFVLSVITFWPERAFALSTFVFMSLGGSVLLWLEVMDGRIVGAPDQPTQDADSQQ